jgi:hypothetical protein
VAAAGLVEGSSPGLSVLSRAPAIPGILPDSHDRSCYHPAPFLEVEMSRIIVFAVSACLTLHASVVGAQSATDRSAAQKQIAGSEKAIMDAILKNDAKTFHSSVLPDSVAVGGDGVMKASDFDKMMNQMKVDCKFTKWGLQESTFYWLTDTAVVHIYKATADGTCQGQPVPDTWASTVWTNKGGKWQAAFHHESPVTPTAPQK